MFQVAISLPTISFSFDASLGKLPQYGQCKGNGSFHPRPSLSAAILSPYALTNACEIAEKLFLAEGISTIFDKLHVDDRTQAAALAWHHGLVHRGTTDFKPDDT